MRSILPSIHLLAALAIFAFPNRLAAADATARDLGGPAQSITDSAAARRILDEINQAHSSPGFERVTSALPVPLLMSRLEQTLDPALLRRFGGPGLDIEELHAAVNRDLGAGGKPHLMMATGLLLYGGLKQMQRVHLPHLRLGASGSSYGVSGSVPTGGFCKLDGGIYVVAPRSAGDPPGRRLLLAFNGMDIPAPLPKLLHSARVEIEQIVRPGIVPITSHAIRVNLPFRCRGVRLGLGAGLSVTPAEATRVKNIRPSFGFRRLAVDLDLRQVDLGGASYLDTAVRASVRPLRIEGRWRQDPWRRPAYVETRIQAADLLPYLRRLSRDWAGNP